jgi:hypothetical protein
MIKATWLAAKLGRDMEEMRQDADLFDNLNADKHKIFILTISRDGLDTREVRAMHYSEKETLKYIVDVGTADKDTRIIEAIRSIDVNGRVREYRVAFNGKLSLELVIQEG